jgi:hypothetical protein
MSFLSSIQLRNLLFRIRLAFLVSSSSLSISSSQEDVSDRTTTPTHILSPFIDIFYQGKLVSIFKMTISYS